MCHDLSASVSAFRTQVDYPVAGADHVEVVFDHHQRMAGVQQLAQGLHQLGDVVEMQAGRRFIKQEQGAFAGRALAAFGHVLRGLCQITRQLQALRFAAAERGYGLAELHVIQPHIHQRPQHAQHVAVLRKYQGCLVHGQTQHISHVQHFATAFDRHLQHFGAVAQTEAVLAAQVHVAQELHFHMFEAAAAAGRATAVATIEAELGGGVAAFACQRRGGKQLADGVPRAHVTGRVGTRRFADGRLIDEHHIGQMIRAQQPVVRARCFGSLAEMAQQCRGQHILHQRGFAGAAHAGDAYEALQRDVERHVFQVVRTHAFKDQARRVRSDRVRLPALYFNYLPVSAQILAGESVGMLECLGRAVEHDLPAALAGAGAHVDHAVGRPHHGRVVLYHHERIACITQAQHGLGNAVHVARVQADAGFIEHE